MKIEIDDSVARKAVSLLSHYAQKYVMEKYANKPVIDDSGYEDNIFAALDELCALLEEPMLDRSELIESAMLGGITWE